MIAAVERQPAGAPCAERSTVAALWHDLSVAAGADIGFSRLPQHARHIAELGARESERIERAVAKRQIEFATGRACARIALAAIGYPGQEVPSLETRRPVWPSGTVGSISHTAGVAAAVAVRSTEVLAIGLDVESDGGLSDGVRKLVLVGAEHERSRNVHANVDGHDKLVFGIKEAVYKCVNPVVGHYFGFQDVEIDFPEPGRFSASPTGRRDIDFPWRSLEGRYTKFEGRLWSTAWAVRSNAQH